MGTIFADYMNLMEAAAYMGIHPQSVRRLIKQGHCQCFMKFQGVWMARRGELTEFKAVYDPKMGRKSWPEPAQKELTLG